MYSEAQQYQYHYEMLINLGKVLNRIAYNGCIIEQKACAWHVLAVSITHCSRQKVPWTKAMA